MQGIRIFPNFHTTNLVVVNCRFAIRSFFFTSLFALRKLTILVYNWNKICTSNHKLWCTHVEILWEDELWWKCDTSINIGLEFAILKKRHLHKMFRLIMNAKEKEIGRHSLTRWAIASKCFMFFCSTVLIYSNELCPYSVLAIFHDFSLFLLLLLLWNIIGHL